MSAARKVIVGMAAAVMVVALALAPAFACGPQGTLNLSSRSAPAGSAVVVSGSGFTSGTTGVYWNSSNGPLLATTSGSSFSITITIPPAPPGFHSVVAEHRMLNGSVMRAVAIIEVTNLRPARGYWLAASDGGIFAFGDAGFFGSTGGIPLNRPVVGMAATPSGNGYWLVASDGGIFAFGDASFLGSTGGIPLNRPIVGMAATPTGSGYYLVAADGGVFAFGTDAVFFGAVDRAPLNKPVVAITPTRSGRGYWLSSSDGGIFAFGDAAFLGSAGGIPLAKSIVGTRSSGTDAGYWLVAADGGIFAFGDAAFSGSTGGIPLNRPIVGMAATPSRSPATQPPVCRNSSDPACGTFFWDPAPTANQPLVASFTRPPTAGVVGQQMFFDVAWSDPDAPLRFDDLRVSDLPGNISIVECPPSSPPRYGAWTPPAAVPGSGTLRYPVTFAQPGTYYVIVRLATGDDCHSPYASDAEIQTQVVVDPTPHG